MLEFKERDGEKVVVLEGRELPLYEFGGSSYFLDSIPMGCLARDEKSQPRPRDEAQVKKIAESIKKKGLMQPLLSRYDEGRGKVLITEGQHRWYALRDVLEAQRIPCLVYVNRSDNIALLCGLEANKTDRARGLSGGDIARKTHSLMADTRAQLEVEQKRSVSEGEILAEIGVTSRAREKEFLLGHLIEYLRSDDSVKIGKYISEKQSRECPITAKNFFSFLAPLIKTVPVGENENNYREDEQAGVVKITNTFAEILLEDKKWDPNNPLQPQHIHAVNACRIHPLTACGHFIGKIVERHGGNDSSIGPCFAPLSNINWDEVTGDMKVLLEDDIWDQDNVRFCRSLEGSHGEPGLISRLHQRFRGRVF